MNSRRDFLKHAHTTLPVGVSGLFLATGEQSASAEVESVGGLVGRLPQNIVYSKDQQGIWKGKAGSHVPTVSTSGGQGQIVTKHGMSPKHYIVRHTLIDAEGKAIFGHTFAYDDSEARSEFDASTIQSGKVYYALSFCNKHDLWLAQVTL